MARTSSIRVYEHPSVTIDDVTNFVYVDLGEGGRAEKTREIWVDRVLLDLTYEGQVVGIKLYLPDPDALEPHLNPKKDKNGREITGYFKVCARKQDSRRGFKRRRDGEEMARVRRVSAGTRRGSAGPEPETEPEGSGD